MQWFCYIFGLFGAFWDLPTNYTVRLLCLLDLSVPCWVFVHASFLRNPKPKNPGKLSRNAPLIYMWFNFILLHHLIDRQQTAYPPPPIQSCNIFTRFGWVGVPPELIAPTNNNFLPDIYYSIYTFYTLCIITLLPHIWVCQKEGPVVDWLVGFILLGWVGVPEI